MLTVRVSERETIQRFKFQHSHPGEVFKLKEKSMNVHPIMKSFYNINFPKAVKPKLNCTITNWLYSLPLQYSCQKITLFWSNLKATFFSDQKNQDSFLFVRVDRSRQEMKRGEIGQSVSRPYVPSTDLKLNFVPLRVHTQPRVGPVLRRVGGEFLFSFLFNKFLGAGHPP